MTGNYSTYVEDSTFVCVKATSSWSGWLDFQFNPESVPSVLEHLVSKEVWEQTVTRYNQGFLPPWCQPRWSRFAFLMLFCAVYLILIFFAPYGAFLAFGFAILFCSLVILLFVLVRRRKRAHFSEVSERLWQSCLSFKAYNPFNCYDSDKLIVDTVRLTEVGGATRVPTQGQKGPGSSASALPKSNNSTAPPSSAGDKSSIQQQKRETGAKEEQQVPAEALRQALKTQKSLFTSMSTFTDDSTDGGVWEREEREVSGPGPVPSVVGSANGSGVPTLVPTPLPTSAGSASARASSSSPSPVPESPRTSRTAPTDLA
uniref:Uncharacterized protein n=1 Tax=Chromera velia CCMP2878 TaxID=1169474 RepID=A0A0G4HTV1_9ALVE|eukprot:Cvel_8529.t1-p1 / transcript=Cvel_8529.t1 / gene=Cvel_8529 / organism=Chromera_velia_CCMP2878 / gene_product=hypothetical protein / transcript_product=hypothetical protein / location=Cvel_scaffold473:1404-3191(-) / protein_length=314 / sequence_SO=supercontig / SO=protein_coding / is_pseudo=false